MIAKPPIEVEADALRVAAYRAGVRGMRVQISHSAVFVNGREMSQEQIYAERIRIEREIGRRRRLAASSRFSDGRAV